MKTTSLRLKTFENILYSAATRCGIYVFQGLTSIVLARNLLSTDYGIVGFALIFINFLSQFSDFGLANAMIQKKDISERDISTAFTLKVCLSVLVFAVAMAFSVLSTKFLDDGAVQGVVQVLGSTFLLSALALIPTILLTRRLNYRILGGLQVLSTAISSILAIIFAINGFRYWSIVFGTVISSVINTVVLLCIAPFRITLSFDRDVARRILMFGSPLFFQGLIAFAILNMDNFIIGSVKGSETLGYYTIAFNWGSMVCGLVASVVTWVVFPSLSRIQDDKEGLRAVFLKVLRYVTFIAVVLNIGILIVSREFLVFVLGRGTEKWNFAVESLRILCLYGVVRSFLEPFAMVFMALGLTTTLLRAAAVAGICEMFLLYPAVTFFSIEGAAWVVTLAVAFQCFVYFPALKRALDVTYTTLLMAMVPAVISAVTFLVPVAVGSWMDFSLFGALVKVATFVVSYFLLFNVFTKWILVKEVSTMVLQLTGTGRR